MLSRHTFNGLARKIIAVDFFRMLVDSWFGEDKDMLAKTFVGPV